MNMSKVGKRREVRDFDITPLELNCAACNGKFFDTSSGGVRDSVVSRLNQLFLESLSIEVPDSNDSILCLRFCPPCTLQLCDLDSLLTELESLQIRIQNVKEYICSTVTNTAFKWKDQAVRNKSEASNALILSIREQVMQSWISSGRSEGNGLISTKQQQQVRSKATASRPVDFECNGQNGLEIFDQIEEEQNEAEGEENSGSFRRGNTDVNVPYVTLVTSPLSHGRAQSIKIEPDWGEVEVETTSPFNPADQMCEETMQIGTPANNTGGTIVNGATVESNPSPVYFDQVRQVNNELLYSNPIVTSQSQQLGSSGFYSPTTNAMTSARAVAKTEVITNGPESAKSAEPVTRFEIEMCTLCFKYVATGVKHTCGDKSTTTMYQCGYCNAVFHSERVLKEHVHRHLDVGSNKSKGRVYGCKTCKKAFATLNKLTHHMKMDHPSVHKCQLCPKTFKELQLFRIHMIAHSRTPPKKQGVQGSTTCHEMKKASFYSFVARS